MGSPHRDIAQAKDFIAPPGYSRHRPEATLLYRLVADHCPRLRDRRAAEGRTLPQFVEDECEAYRRCGLLEHDFLRVKCDACQAEKLVACSCKSRGFCPNCGGRRMAETGPLSRQKRFFRPHNLPHRLTQGRLNALSALNAAVACQPHERDRLERLCRYITRPAICLDRLSTDSAGQVVYRLKHPFRDGAPHVLFSPEDFIARLAALVPKPGSNLTRYHGVFAPNSAFRRAVVPDAGKHRRRKGKGNAASCQDGGSKPPKRGPVDDSDLPIAPLTWAQRLKRVFEFDITLCPHCGGRLRVIADVTDPIVIRKILDHVHQRAPPVWRSIPEQYAI